MLDVLTHEIELRSIGLLVKHLQMRKIQGLGNRYGQEKTSTAY